MPETLVFTATYNEAGNIEAWVRSVRRSVPDADLLVVDDASPDGTGNILDQLAQEFPNLQVIHRAGKLGLASAHLVALKAAEERGYRTLVTLDADGSHQAWQIPLLLQAAPSVNFVVGTRYRGGSHRAGRSRRLLSWGANAAARAMLPTGLSEYTTSFRVFDEAARRAVLDADLHDAGYAFFLEVVEVIYQAGLTLGEVPIEFVDRVHGSSKIPKNQIATSMQVLITLWARRVTGGKNRVP